MRKREKRRGRHDDSVQNVALTDTENENLPGDHILDAHVSPPTDSSGAPSQKRLGIYTKPPNRCEMVQTTATMIAINNSISVLQPNRRSNLQCALVSLHMTQLCWQSKSCVILMISAKNIYSCVS